MPEAAKNYSITELEMCGLAMNIATFSHLLKKVDFDAIVDHLAITHIMRRKAEPATTRIKRLLELLSPYSFNLYYIKGKDVVLSDFFSRQKMDDRKIEIEENSPFQEGIISEIYERPNTSYVQEPQELKDLIDTTKLIQKFLLKQMDIENNSRHHKKKSFEGNTFAPHY